MANPINLHIRVDPEIKTDAEKIYSAFGITLSDAINIFLHQSIFTGGLPFELRRPRYNAETEAAIQEANDIIAGKLEVKSYVSVAEMNADIDKDGD